MVDDGWTSSPSKVCFYETSFFNLLIYSMRIQNIRSAWKTYTVSTLVSTYIMVIFNYTQSIFPELLEFLELV